MNSETLPRRKKSFIKRKLSQLKARVESELLPSARTNLTKTKSCTDVRLRNKSNDNNNTNRLSWRQSISSKWSSSLQSLNENAVLSDFSPQRGYDCCQNSSVGSSVNSVLAGSNESLNQNEFGERVLQRTQSFTARTERKFTSISNGPLLVVNNGCVNTLATNQRYLSNFELATKDRSNCDLDQSLDSVFNYSDSRFQSDCMILGLQQFSLSSSCNDIMDSPILTSPTSNRNSFHCSIELIPSEIHRRRHSTPDICIEEYFNKSEVRSRSLTHLDNLDPNLLKYNNNHNSNHYRQSSDENEILKDSKSEPDCTITQEHLLVPNNYGSNVNMAANTAASGSTSGTTSIAPSCSSNTINADEISVTCCQQYQTIQQPQQQQQSPLLETYASITNNRRHMMIRSQVSSSEYFSIVFDGDDYTTYPKEEFIPATKGVVLFEALKPICEERGIDIYNCDVFLDNSRKPLLIRTLDTTFIAGKQLRILVHDGSNKKLTHQGSRSSRKPSANYRSKGKFFSSSTEESSISSSNTVTLSTATALDASRASLDTSDQIKKKERQRWSGFFSNSKDTKMELLVDQLNYYSKNGIPLLTNNQLEDCSSCTELIFSLESDWKQLIDFTKLTEKHQQQQTALWELITTEVDYIKMLKVVTNLFLACLQSLQQANILLEIDKNKLFSNINEIHSTNLKFWKTSLYPMLKYTRDTKEPLNPEMLLNGFIQFRDLFDSYIRYCSDQSKCQHYCKEMHLQNELFTAYLVWCETQRECNRLRLMDILVRPMQRLTKYGLLLKVIYKNTELKEHKDSLSLMIKSVDDFVNNVNSTLKCRQDSESLKRMISRIESYDAVESKEDDLEKIIRNHCVLDLTRPMLGCSAERQRHLILEDDFKLKDPNLSKLEVHCILLTDLLLVGKSTTKKGAQSIRIIRQPYIVDRLIVTELSRDSTTIGLVYLNEFNMAVAAFTLQSSDIKKMKSWIENIRKAQVIYRQAKLASAPMVRQQSVSDAVEQTDFNAELSIDDTQSLTGVPLLSRSPMANSSHASRLSSLIHSHSGSMEMNEQSSVGSINNQSSRGISVETDQRTASVSSDEGVQSLPIDKSLIKAPKTSLKRVQTTYTQMKISTPNTLSVQPFNTTLGQSLPNLVLASPNSCTVNTTYPNLHTLSVPMNTRHPSQHLLSPNQRGISYPPPSPTRGNLRRGYAISQNKNPPLIKTRHVNSTITAGSTSITTGPTHSEFDVPMIAGVSPIEELANPTISQNKQAIMKRLNRTDNRRPQTSSSTEDDRIFTFDKTNISEEN